MAVSWSDEEEEDGQGEKLLWCLRIERLGRREEERGWGGGDRGVDVREGK